MDTEKIEGRQGITLINDLSFPRRRLPVFPSGCLSHTQSQLSTPSCQMNLRPRMVYKKVRMGLGTCITVILSSYVATFLVPSKSRQPILFFDGKCFYIKGDPYDLQPFLKTPNA